MLRVHNGQLVKFRFAFLVNGEFYDPLDQAVPVDIYATVSRGNGGTGEIIHSSTSLINTSYRIVSITPPSSIMGIRSVPAVRKRRRRRRGWREAPASRSRANLIRAQETPCTVFFQKNGRGRGVSYFMGAWG